MCISVADLRQRMRLKTILYFCSVFTFIFIQISQFIFCVRAMYFYLHPYWCAIQLINYYTMYRLNASHYDLQFVCMVSRYTLVEVLCQCTNFFNGS